MEPFSISDIYKDVNGDRVIDINPLPKNCCNFDCVFCPFGKTKIKTNKRHYFSDSKNFIKRLEKFLVKNEVDKVYINPEGEALYNTELPRIIELIKNNECNIKILSNGYIFNQPEYFILLKEFEEVIGELAAVTEKEFQKLQRPIENYTLENYIDNMSKFSKNYKGKFIIAVNILKNYNDSSHKINKLKKIIKGIDPDKILLETQDDDRLKDTFAVSNQKLQKIKNEFDFLDCQLKQ